MELVGQLAGGIAHDFNNVLSAIMMATDFLLNAHKPTDPSFKDIMQIKQNANRAAALVRQLLAFSRKQTLRPQVLDLGETLSDLGMLLKRLIGEKVALEIVHGRDLWPVKVDISQFEQVIVNLAVNARDAMPDGGKLTLRTSNVRPRNAAICLQRHAESRLCAGRGERQRDRHSAGHHRARSSSRFSPPRTSARALDLGFPPFTASSNRPADLSTPTRSRAGRHSVSSCHAMFRAPTKCWRKFPRRKRPAIAGALAAADSLARAAAADLTGHGTILLVEDEEGLRALNARGLSSRGYTVLEAGNGVEAIEALRENMATSIWSSPTW